MEKFLHDTTFSQQDSIIKLISKHGFEGYGVYFSIIERISFLEKPIDKNIAIFKLRLTKKQQRILNFCVEIGLFIEENNKLFIDNLLEISEKKISKNNK